MEGVVRSVARPEERLRAALAVVGDLVPRALWSNDVEGTVGLEGTAAPAHLRGVRWVCPAPGALDHWETVATGEPWAYLEAGPDGMWAGLQAEGERAVARASAVLADEGRLERLVTGAARFGPWSSTGAIAVRMPPQGRFEERVLLGRSVETDQLGPAVLEGIVEAASRGAGLAAGEVAALRFVRVPVDEADTVALRRVMRRVVRIWQAVWRVPQPREAVPATKEGLEKALRAVYRASLRNLVHEDPRVRARLRVEARTLSRAYRESGRVRPRLLDVIMDRLGIVD